MRIKLDQNNIYTASITEDSNLIIWRTIRDKLNDPVFKDFRKFQDLILTNKELYVLIDNKCYSYDIGKNVLKDKYFENYNLKSIFGNEHNLLGLTLDNQIIQYENNSIKIETVNNIKDVKFSKDFVSILTLDNTLYVYGNYEENINISQFFDFTNIKEKVKKLVSGVHYCYVILESGKIIGYGNNINNQGDIPEDFRVTSKNSNLVVVDMCIGESITIAVILNKNLNKYQTFSWGKEKVIDFEVPLLYKEFEISEFVLFSKYDVFYICHNLITTIYGKIIFDKKYNSIPELFSQEKYLKIDISDINLKKYGLDISIQDAMKIEKYSKEHLKLIKNKLDFSRFKSHKEIILIKNGKKEKFKYIRNTTNVVKNEDIHHIILVEDEDKKSYALLSSNIKVILKNIILYEKTDFCGEIYCIALGTEEEDDLTSYIIMEGFDITLGDYFKKLRSINKIEQEFFSLIKQFVIKYDKLKEKMTFVHGDIHLYNIMLNYKEKELYLIDFDTTYIKTNYGDLGNFKTNNNNKEILFLFLIYLQNMKKSEKLINFSNNINQYYYGNKLFNFLNREQLYWKINFSDVTFYNPNLNCKKLIKNIENFVKDGKLEELIEEYPSSFIKTDSLDTKLFSKDTIPK